MSQYRHYSTAKDDDKPLAPEDSPETSETTSTSTPPPSSSTDSPSSSSDIPWYLKVDVPKHDTLTPHDVPLPDIPPGSPTILKSLVDFVAEDMGFDDLELLDLRALDPPAGLGPELLMLFGTARSERHLHVSADRLVRWLRKNGINSSADGLLGRNELKIKLRRKARRAKLLGGNNMASLEAAASGGGTGGAPIEVDDGISTQWVCLHAGTIGRKPTQAEGATVDDEGRTTGFGSGATRSFGSTIVVQMFTDAKRKQMDLETLWSRALERSVKQRLEIGEELPEGAMAAFEAAQARRAASGAPEVEEDEFGDEDEPETTSKNFFSSSKFKGQQKRQFSTSARRLSEAQASASATQAVDTADLDIVSSLTQPWLNRETISQLAARLAQDHAGKVQLLDHLCQYLARMTPYEARDALLGSKRVASNMGPGTTDFITASNASMRDMPSAETWQLRALVHATAIQIRHRDYDLAGLVELIREMQEGGLPINRDLCHVLFQAIFTPMIPYGAKPRDETTDSGEDGVASPDFSDLAAQEATLLTLRKETALSLLKTMYERGMETVARDTICSMIAPLARYNGVVHAAVIDPAVYAEELRKAEADGIALNFPVEVDERGVPHFTALDVSVDVDIDVEGEAERPITLAAVAKEADALQTTLESILHQADLPCLDDAQIMDLMRAYAGARDWTRFWDAWHIPPQHGLPRSRTLYHFLYQTMAATKNQALCIDAIQRSYEEMMHEDIPVQPSGSLLAALKDCIRVADPSAEQAVKDLPDLEANMTRRMFKTSKREFVRILLEVQRLKG